jgi:hypothetical protein
MKDKNFLFLTIKCEYAISYKNSQHTRNLVVAHRLRNTALYCKDHKTYRCWRDILPASLQAKIIQFVRVSLGHLGSERCITQFANTLFVRNLGWKVRKLISYCHIYQRVKSPQTAASRLRAQVTCHLSRVICAH